ncbi:MAG: glycosyltransferase [Lachnospiraceae bacterium]|nr:glycosyltransferase [Lachnospiraceae bacterium]
MQPLVSVIMSVYSEKRNELLTSINSILEQTYHNIEFIIVNDNPENNIAKKILEDFQMHNSKIKVINNSKNYGLVYSLNKAISIANGEYIARMDADDKSVKKRIECQMNWITKTKADLLGGYILLMDEAGHDTDIIRKFPLKHKSIKKYLRWGDCVPHPTWIAKKKLFQVLGGYRNIPFCEDYDFLLRTIASGYKIENIPMICLHYRIRSNGISQSNSIEQKVRSIYLGDNINNILCPEQEILRYFSSELYNYEKEQYKEYLKLKSAFLINKNFNADIIFAILKNKFFQRNIKAKFSKKILFMR